MYPIQACRTAADFVKGIHHYYGKLDHRLTKRDFLLFILVSTVFTVAAFVEALFWKGINEPDRVQ